MSSLKKAHAPTDTTSALLHFVQKAFIIHRRRLLLVRKADTDPHYPGYWDFPGGGMIAGENVDEHIVREVWEETGISITPGKPFHIWQWEMPWPASSESSRIYVVAVARHCRPDSFEATTCHQMPSDHLADVQWVPLSDLDSYKIIPNHKPAFEEFLGSLR
ncbi:MAG TPA: NUDIX hydrolase [Gemmatimonadales bacterium]|nr:NUDIX hydrolase [Gemmatimonadales bacterium]